MTEVEHDVADVALRVRRGEAQVAAAGGDRGLCEGVEADIGMRRRPGRIWKKTRTTGSPGQLCRIPLPAIFLHSTYFPFIKGCVFLTRWIFTPLNFRKVIEIYW